jgi:peptide/nickel transport system substrate-binding protein
VKLDGLEILHFDTIDTMVTAVAAGEVDAIQQFNVIGGENLLDNPDFVVLTPPSGTHRQIWFNTRNGQFTDPLVRQAMAWTFDRDRFVSTLFNGLADKGNDFPIPPSFTTWFPGPEVVEQRNRDIDKAVELLAEAGVDGLSSVINCGEVQEVPDLAALMQQDARDAGFDLSINVIPQATFYDDSWCPPGDEGETPCLNSDEFGIVDWGHRPTPDVWLTSALQTDAVWNASVYADAEYDALVTAYQGSFTPEDQKAAIEPIAIKLWNDVPAIYPYFYNYLSGHRTNVSGMQSTALGHSIMINATKS